ncbi:hypothetical protein [Micromonospora sp. RL09-050-HVF-A]|uniref:hypothetical protein n=1 Tax=unclassified Micromonospora TaxID=2617518 RepID=UPI001C6055AF|nr:hypothetical protein [Micromonospora sp. RL09-050-HVF-A]MBW4704620.1 hypothetical protein [Micromonospora sp. RL09-050-HVF-A]
MTEQAGRLSVIEISARSLHGSRLTGGVSQRAMHSGKLLSQLGDLPGEFLVGCVFVNNP